MDGSNNKAAESKQPADRDKVKTEREARRLAKVAAKHKNQDKNRDLSDANVTTSSNTIKEPISAKNDPKIVSPVVSNKVGPAKQAKKQSKQNDATSAAAAAQKSEATVVKKLEQLNISKSEGAKVPTKSEVIEDKTKKTLTKAERRAIQEAQRAAKAGKPMAVAKPGDSASGAGNKQKPPQKSPDSKLAATIVVSSGKVTVRKSPSKVISTHRVKLFNHLYANETKPSNIINSSTIPPAIIQLGVQYATGVVKGSNARCIAFLNAIKLVLKEYQTPSEKEFGRSFESALKTIVEYLQACRPVAVSVHNAVKHIRWQISQFPKGSTDEQLKLHLIECVEIYISDQIEKAAEAISITVQEKISDGDVLLTFGCSSLIQHILTEAKANNRKFRVIVVDARPCHEGLEMLRRLVNKDIHCTCIQINAVGFIMPEVTKVLLGAHALLANGYVMSRIGTAQVALIAKHFNVPVLVCCETHKFSERVQTDAFVYNEIGNPQDLVIDTKDVPPSLANWKSIPHLTPLNLYYDVTPPELVSAVVTEIAILPCTSVPVILRIKPSEVGY